MNRVRKLHPKRKITGRFDDVLLEKAGEEFRVVYEAAGYDLNNFPKLPVIIIIICLQKKCAYTNL
jgi:hypothetical protein